MKDTLVMKFGGTSVGSVEAMQQVIEIARTAKSDWRNVAVIVSAMSGTTDRLLDGAKSAVAGNENMAEQIASELSERHFDVLEQLAPNAIQARDFIETLLEEFVSLCHAIRVLGEASPRALDAIASLGERMSAPLVATALEEAGIPATAVDTREVLVTDDVYQFASPDMEATRQRAEQIIKPLFDAGQIPVITGFIGASQEGVVTTLGRGGSDFSGAIFGVVLDAQEIWINGQTFQA